MDKRPLGFIGAVFFLTVLIFTRFGYEIALVLMPILLVAVFLIFLKQNKLRFFLTIASSVLCASLIFSSADSVFTTNEQYFSGENVSVEGVIWERPYVNNDKYYVVIKTDKIGGEEVSIKIRVSSVSLPENAEFYSKVKLRANLYKVSTLDKTASASLKSKNICLTGGCKANTFTVLPNSERTLRYHLLTFRYKIYDEIESILPDDVGGFIAGIVLGEKGLLSDTALERFRITGTSHILVVSGLHVAILAGFVFKVLSLLLTKKLSGIVSIGFVLLYMAFTGFTPSVVRSGIMMIVYFVSVIFHESPDSLNTLGISALILTAVSPFSLYNVGTVFSFASVFGILLMQEYVYKKIRFGKIKNNLIRKCVRSLFSLILVPLSAQFFTFPVSVLYNINFSFLSIISNVFTTSLTTLSMITGGVGAIILTFFSESFIGTIIMSISVASSKIILHVIDKLSELSAFYANVTNYENYILLILVFMILFMIMISSLSRRKKTALFSVFLAPVFLISNLLPAMYKDIIVQFSVINTGKGLCVVFANDEEAVLLGCGGTYSALTNINEQLEMLKTEKIKAMYLPVNGTMEQMNAASDIKDLYDVESVVTSGKYKLSYLSENTVSADYVSAEYFGGKLKIDYYTKANSSFALARIGNERILINFYGSLSEENLPQGCINPDIYVTMYGNSYKTDFSDTEIFIISNEYEQSVPASARNIHITMNDGTYTKPILL